MSKLDNLQQINTNVPRETLVFDAGGLVIKRPMGGISKVSLEKWLVKQRLAQNVGRNVLSAGNTAYFVPDMLEISTNEYFAVEQRVTGRPLTSDYVKTLDEGDMDIIYNGLANFINDINQVYHVLKQKDLFDSEAKGENIKPVKFEKLLEKINKYLSNKEMKIIRSAKILFDKLSINDSSVVFSHGDMNEHNVFYDKRTKRASLRPRLSVIDFADAKYEVAHYMFYKNFARLKWLDVNRLISEYKLLPRHQQVIIESDKSVHELRNALNNFKWSAVEFLENPRLARDIRLEIIQDNISKLNEISKKIKTSRIKNSTVLFDSIKEFKTVQKHIATDTQKNTPHKK